MSSLFSFVIVLSVVFISVVAIAHLMRPMFSGVRRLVRSVTPAFRLPQTKTQGVSDCVHQTRRVAGATSANKRFHSGNSTSAETSNFSWASLPDIQFKHFDAPPTASYAAFAAVSPCQHSSEHSPHQNSSAQSRFLPQIEKPLKSISLDNRLFKWKKVCAKPDAVFFDPELNEYMVVEYTSAKFYALHRMIPDQVFQLLVSAEVLRSSLVNAALMVQLPAPRVRTFMRFDNKVLEITGWERLLQKVFALVPDLLTLLHKSSISASRLARYYVLINDEFKRHHDKNAFEASTIGRYKHLLMTRELQSVIQDQNDDSELLSTVKEGFRKISSQLQEA